MVLIPFHGEQFEAVEVDGTVWVSVRRMCEGLGLGFIGQFEKLSSVDRAPWATVRVMRMVAEDGKAREVFCLDLDSVPMWLATIESSRVAKDVRAKLVLYQREAAKVLRDHFFGTRGRPQRPLPKLLGLSKAQFIQVALAGYEEYYYSDSELPLRYAKRAYSKAFLRGERGGPRPEGDASVSQIAAFLGVEKAMVERLVNSLRDQETAATYSPRVVKLIELSYELYVMAKRRRELREDSDEEDRAILLYGGDGVTHERVERESRAIFDRVRAIEGLADARYLDPNLLALQGFPRAPRGAKGAKGAKSSNTTKGAKAVVA